MQDVVVTQARYGTPRPSRNLEERLMVGFPGGWRVLAALVQRLLSPRSRLRRALLRRNAVSGWDAASRGDWELMLVRYAPEVEIEFDPEFEALGLGGPYTGHDGMLELIQSFSEEAFGRWEVRPELVLDLRDRVLVLGVFRMQGTASGLELERDWAQLLTSRGGLVVREQEFFGWDNGLRAAGLDPDAVALPTPSRQGR